MLSLRWLVGALNFMSNIGNMMVDMEMHELLGFVVSVISSTNKAVSCSANFLESFTTYSICCGTNLSYWPTTLHNLCTNIYSM